MQNIAVIDYGMGNLHSVVKALRHVADQSVDEIHVVTQPAAVLAADKLVFPGVGGIQYCMAELRRLGLDQAILQAVAEKPVLAVCVGMQALMDRSDENGGVDGLGLMAGNVQHFSKLHADHDVAELSLKVPHMGWNQVHQCGEHALWAGIEQDSRFYFVHSYFVQPTNSAIIEGEAVYGGRFVAVMAVNNLFAVQFHPEKSHQAGLRLYKNFLHWNGH